MKYPVPSSLFTRLFIGALLIALSAPFAQAYVAVDFTNEMNGRSAAYAGATNIKLGEFTGPTPATDTLIHNGGTAVIAAGNTLTAFASSERYIDTNNDSGFDTGEAVVSSANSTLDSTDTVVTGATGVLTAVGTSEALGTIVYTDVNANSSFDTGELIGKIVVSGSAAALTSGTALSEFPLADSNGESSVLFLKVGSDGFDYDNPSAIISYDRDETEPDNPQIVRGGSIGFTTFDENDAFCLSDTNSSDGFDPGEDFWYDVAGTCGAFTAGVDLRVTTDGDVDGPHVRFSDLSVPPPFVVSIGYSDADADGLYDCARGAICEQILYIAGSYAYPTGTLVTPADTVGYLSGGAPGVIDSIIAEAEYPFHIHADPDIVNTVYLGSHLASGGINNAYYFVDTDLDGVYDEEEDVVEVVVDGTYGGNARYFSGHAFFDSVDDDTFNSGEPIFLSADTNLDAGVLSGAGTDDLVVASGSGFLDAFAATNKYHDHNSSGAYADGDDIVDDLDASGYYNADDLLTIQFANSVSDHPIGDDDLDNLYVYKRVGGSCVGSGTDTLLGSIATTPFFETNVTVTDSVFTSATNYCIYADFLAGADAGEYLTLELAQNGADYASTGTSPSDAAVDFSLGEYIMSMSRYMDATMVPTSLVASTLTTYTSTFTTSASLDSADSIWIEFPDE